MDCSYHNHVDCHRGTTATCHIILKETIVSFRFTFDGAFEQKKQPRINTGTPTHDISRMGSFHTSMATRDANTSTTTVIDPLQRRHGHGGNTSTTTVIDLLQRRHGHDGNTSTTTVIDPLQRRHGHDGFNGCAFIENITLRKARWNISQERARFVKQNNQLRQYNYRLVFRFHIACRPT